MLTEAERQRILVDWNDTGAPFPADACVHHLVDQQAAAAPDAVAVVCEGARVTYRQLTERANQLAHHLLACGVEPGSLIGVCLHRGVNAIVAFLAVLKAGAAYVPLDPDYPAPRLAFMTDDANVAVIITEQPLLRSGTTLRTTVLLDRDRHTIAAQPDRPPAVAVSSDDLVYVMYTSGSTGRPKGVQIEHRSLTNVVHWYRNRFAITSVDRCSQFASLVFDVSACEIWAALTSGAQLHLVNRDVPAHPRAVVEWLVEQRITVGFLPTRLAELVIDEVWPATSDLRYLTTVGERLHRWAAPGAPYTLVNLYGPTECAVYATEFVVPSTGPAGDPPIGGPIANTRAYVLDERLMPVPIGVVGELHLGGVGVSRGYLGLPRLTAEKFITDPFTTFPGARLYKTGDLARWRADGVLEFLGRRDHQIKLYGHRIELGEIESVLQRHPGVTQTVVLCREDREGDTYLAAYFTSSQPQPPSPGELRRHLGSQLPHYMIPATFTGLNTMPISLNGKLDRAALPPPDRGRQPDMPAYVAPRSELEAELVALWEELVGVDLVGVNDGFIALGGDSMRAIRIAARIRDQYQVELPLSGVLNEGTVAELARLVERSRLAGTERIDKPVTSAEIVPVKRREPLPASPGQRGVWFHDQLSPGSVIYNEPVVLRLQGGLDTDVLRRCLTELITRHEALRTTLAMVDGELRQIIHPPAHLPVALEDLTARTAAEPNSLIEATVARAVRQRFDLTNDLPVRARLLRTAVNEHLLVLAMHHSAMDGWSVNVLFDELAALYEKFAAGCAPSLAAPLIQYADYAAWQWAVVASGELDTELDYWRERMAGAPPVLELPTDFSRPPWLSGAGALARADLPADLVDCLDELSRSAGVTQYMTLLAAFQILLARYTSTNDIVVGTLTAGRVRPETEAVVGYFVNLLPLRCDLSGSPTFRQLLARIRSTVIGASAHQQVPFPRLVEELGSDRNTTTPLVQVCLVLQDVYQHELAFAGIEATFEYFDVGVSKFDLTVNIIPGVGDGGVRLTAEYRTDLFTAGTVERLLGHLRTLLESAVADPDCPVTRLPMLTKAERQRILVDWNDTDAPFPADMCVHHLVDQCAAAAPEAVAVVCDGGRVTYRELTERANRLSHHLLGCGVEPGSLVGVCLHRGVNAIVAFLAVLKAGAAYVPLDPDYPADRLAFMIENAETAVIITEQPLLRSGTTRDTTVLLDRDRDAIAVHPVQPPAITVTSNDLAYVMYTSGSTGRPKGVQIEHRSLANVVHWYRNRFAITSIDRCSQFANLAFDVSACEIWAALTSGAQLHLVNRDVPTHSRAVVEWLVEQRITVGFLPTRLAELVIDEVWPATSDLRYLITAGDRLCRWAAPDAPYTLVNLYGPTECAVYATEFVVPHAGPAGDPPIGCPVANTRAYVLDERLMPVPTGVVGELYLGGVGVARGYLGLPRLTADKFIADPFTIFPDVRLYRTGDLARWRADGVLEFLGRRDNQIKLYGYRIELGEIESSLRAHPDVRDAVVIRREDRPGQPWLVAYVVPAVVVPAGGEPRAAVLRGYLAARLPAYMIPGAFVTLDRFSVSPNGKLDRSGLPAPAPSYPAAVSQQETGPSDTLAIQDRIRSIWMEVVQVHDIGMDERLFNVGGASLHIARIHQRVVAAFGLDDLRMVDLFTYPTLRSYADHVQSVLRRSSND